MLTAQTEDAILQRLRRGDSVASIALQMRVRRPDISGIAKKHNIERRRGRPPLSSNRVSSRQDIIDVFQELYRRGHLDSEKQVGDIVGVSRQYVWAVLARAKIPASRLIAECRARRARGFFRLRLAVHPGPPVPFSRLGIKSVGGPILPLPREISAC
jgi:hypothetical protein